MSLSTGKRIHAEHWHRFLRWLRHLWQRVIMTLRGPQPVYSPPPPPPGRLSERRTLTAPIVVPARGYVFTFSVRAAFVWSSDGITREMLNGTVQACTPYAVRVLTGIAAARARNYPAHRARELEVELQRQLVDEGPWRFERGGARVMCHPYVWVELDENVKQAVRPYWEQLIKLDCEYDVDTKKAQYADRLSRQWLSVLEKLVDNPMAGGAARLTDEALAAVVQDLLAERQANQQRFDDLLLDRLQSGDAYERATSFDLLADRQRSRSATGSGAAD